MWDCGDVFFSLGLCALGKPEGTLLKQSFVSNLNLSLVAVLVLGIAYFGLQLFLNTSSPFLIAKGTSMEPIIHAGDMLLNKSIPATEIKVGDIVAFDVPPEHRERLKVPPTVAHRVIRIVDDQGHLAFVTKGDNSEIDSYEVPSSAIRGVVVKNLGPLGRPIQFLSNKSVLLLGAIAVLAFLGITVAAFSFLPKDQEANEGNTGEAVGINQALENLATAVSEYGTHLQSHTAVVMNLGETTDELRQAAHDQGDVSSGLRQAVLEQNQILEGLKGLVINASERSRAEGPNRELRRQFTESPGLTVKPVRLNEEEKLDQASTGQKNTNPFESQQNEPEAKEESRYQNQELDQLILRSNLVYADLTAYATTPIYEVRNQDLREGVLRLNQLLVELKGFVVKPLELAQKKQVTEAVYRLNQVLVGLGKLAQEKASRKRLGTPRQL